MKILVLGKNGQLGQSIKKVVSTTSILNEYIFLGRDELDITNKKDISDYFNNNNIKIIINCSAYTNVDKAEKDKLIANQINHLAVKHIAIIANKKNIKFIHISTDQVFDGKKKGFYYEDDETNPVNIYGKTKLAGEKAILFALPFNGMIIRTSWLYSEYRKNYVKNMITLGKEKNELSVVIDQISSPTFSNDLAKLIIVIIDNDIFKKYNNKTQIYHFANEGFCSRYDFSKKIFELTNSSCNLSQIYSSEFPRLSETPKNTILSKDKIKEVLNIKISSWEDSLSKCIKLMSAH